MQAIIERHRGRLSLDTVEAVRRIIISTFTNVQTPRSAHIDVSHGGAPMRDSARFHFGFTVPCVMQQNPREAAIEHIERWLLWLTGSISDLGIEVTPGVGNFLVLGFNDAAVGRSAASADVFLSAHGFILRSVRGYGLPNCLRPTVRNEEANRGVVAALAEFMRSERD
jgi:hypothetical protein